jgi:hypothetical protein
VACDELSGYVTIVIFRARDFFHIFSKVAAVSACRKPSIIGCNWKEGVVREANKAVVRGLLPSL